MDFEIIGEITYIESIAVERSIRDLARLRKKYGPGRWRVTVHVLSLRGATAPKQSPNRMRKFGIASAYGLAMTYNNNQ